MSEQELGEQGPEADSVLDAVNDAVGMDGAALDDPAILEGALIELALMHTSGELTDEEYHRAAQEVTGG